MGRYRARRALHIRLEIRDRRRRCSHAQAHSQVVECSRRLCRARGAQTDDRDPSPGSIPTPLYQRQPWQNRPELELQALGLHSRCRCVSCCDAG